MSASTLSSGTNLEYGGFYLPSIAFGYLAVQTENHTATLFNLSPTNWYLGLSVLALVSAVLVHGLLKSVFGPKNSGPASSGGGGPNPMNRDVVTSRMFYAIFKTGRPVHYRDKSLFNIVKTLDDFPIKKRRLLLALSLAFSVFGLLIFFPYSISQLIPTLYSENLVPQGILFLQFVWVLQLSTFKHWPSVYLMDSRQQPKLGEDTDEFGIFLLHVDALKDFSWEVDSSSGGELKLHYESIAKDADEEMAIFESVVMAFSGTVAQSEYPCKRLSVTVVEDDLTVGEYQIESTTAQAYARGEIDFEEILTHILAQL